MADITQTASGVLLISGGSKTGKLGAGVTVTQGQPIYLDTTTSLALSDANVTAAENLEGIALSAGAPGQVITYAPVGSVVNIGATLAPGALVLVSQTAGRLTSTYGDLTNGAKVILIGIADDSGNLPISGVMGGVLTA